MVEKKKQAQDREYSKDEEVAIHEAAHAVAFYSFGKRFTSVSIVPQRFSELTSLGRVVMGGNDFRSPIADLAKPWCSVRLPEGEKLAMEAQVRAQIRLAGVVALELFTGVKVKDQASGEDDLADAQHWILLAAALAGSRKRIKKQLALKWALERTRAFLSRPPIRPAIEAVTAELLECHEMTYQEVVKIIRRSERARRRVLRRLRLELSEEKS